MIDQVIAINKLPPEPFKGNITETSQLNLLDISTYSFLKFSQMVEARLKKASQAMASVRREGGINLNEQYLNMAVRGDKAMINIPVPVGFEWLKTATIKGFVPAITKIQSGTAQNLPFFAGLLDK